MIILLVLSVWVAMAKSCSEHSLMFTYTYMSNPPADKPEFYAERHLNGRVYASYNSWTNTSRPEVEWVKDYPSFWTRNNSRSDKHTWFKFNTATLVSRMNLSAADNHVMQWTHGCKATMDHLGQLSYMAPKDYYTFNGKPLLTLNPETLKFEGLDPAGAGALIAAKWNAFFPKSYFNFYNTTCMDTLRRIETVKAAFDGLSCVDI